MSTTPETFPSDSKAFDLESLDQDDYGAAYRALSDEYGRIALLAPRALLLLGTVYEPPVAGSHRERMQYEIELAEGLDEIANIWSAQQALKPLLIPSTGPDARKRVFLNVFYGLSSSAPAEELTNAIEARQNYMTTLRMVNEYGVTLGEYRALQETVVLDEASIDMTTQTDKAAFAQLLLMQQQYQAGDRNG